MFQLPQLKYGLGDLEPYISQKTLEFHYLKHHQTYIDNLNRLILGTKYENMSLEEIVKESVKHTDDVSIFNNAAQTWNHTFFFDSMRPQGGQKPNGKLSEQIAKSFGSYENFKQEFKATALSQFGSGWAWVVKDAQGHIGILKTSNADTPLAHNLKALLTIDVWEHAYYLDYQNRRGDFIDAFLDHLAYWQQ